MAHGYVAAVAVSHAQDHRFGVQVEGGGYGVGRGESEAAAGEIPSSRRKAATIVEKVGIGVESRHQGEGLGCCAACTPPPSGAVPCRVPIFYPITYVCKRYRRTNLDRIHSPHNPRRHKRFGHVCVPVQATDTQGQNPCGTAPLERGMDMDTGTDTGLPPGK